MMINKLISKINSFRTTYSVRGFQMFLVNIV